MAAVVFEMLAGQPPIRAHTLPELVRSHTQPAPRLETLAPDVPALADAIAQALERDEEARPASARSSPCWCDRRRSPRCRRARGEGACWRRRHRSSIPAPRFGRGHAALLAGFLTAGAVAMHVVARARRFRQFSSTSFCSAPESAPRSRWIAPAPNWSAPSTPSKARLVTGTLSPDRRLVATLAADGTACVWNALTGQPLAACAFLRAHPTCLAFSTDGARLALASAASIFSWRWKEAGAVARLDFEGGAAGLAWLRGERLAIARTDGLWIAEPTGDAHRRVAGRFDAAHEFRGQPGRRGARAGFR